MMQEKKKLYLEIAIIINKKLYTDKIISSYVYMVTEDKLLKENKNGFICN